MSSNRGQVIHWHLYPTAASLWESAARAVSRAAVQAIAGKGAFRLVLAGGNTPRSAYEQLRRRGADWHGWHIYFGDERCVPTDDPERNSRMAFDAWLDYVDIPRGQIHPIPAELGPEVAAATYAEVLRPVEEFDLVMLGLGPDGHTASLFPGHPWGERPGDPGVLAVRGAPKPPPDRVSLSARRLSAAQQVLFLVTGRDKKEAIHRWRAGDTLPAGAIVPRSGVDVMVELPAFE